MKTDELTAALKYWRLSSEPDPFGIDLWDEDERKNPRPFVLDSHAYTYKAWEGEEIVDDYIALDTETTFIGDMLDIGRIPQLVIAQLSSKSPYSNFIIHPNDMPRFIEMHRAQHFVFFNIAFDVPVIEKDLLERGAQKAINILWEMADGGQFHDVMLLDQLVRIAEGRSPFHQRALRDVALEIVDVELEKEESPRKHYDTVLRLDYRGVNPDFYEYAARDSRATWLCFDVLWAKAWEIHKAHAGQHSSEVDPARAKCWAPLTEQIQVRAALALAWMSREGVLVDSKRLEGIIAGTKAELEEAVADFEADDDVRAFEKSEKARILRHNSSGEVELTEKGAPSKSIKLVRRFFVELCRKHGERPPKTDKDFICTARDDYLGMKAYDQEKIFEKYFRLQDLASALSKPRNVRAHIAEDGCIHTRYRTLVKTGRTSSQKPQIQNWPREGSLRSCLVPRDGYVFYSADYSSIELVALASVCKHRYGYSRLGDRIGTGEDPHAFTAAQIIGKPLSEVTSKERQAAKVVNFGVPGGMGSEALAHQARTTYGVDMSPEQAQKWKQRLIREVYPEMGEFLDDYLDRFVSGALGIPVEEVVEDLIEVTEADSFNSRSRKWILASVERALRTGIKANGDPYDEGWLEKVWLGLRRAYGLSKSVIGQNRKIEKTLNESVTGKSVSRVFFPTRAVTLTGRIWSDVSFQQAHNAQFQGLAADGAKLALYRLMREGYRPLLFVHDEVIAEVPDDDTRDMTAASIKRIMVEEMAHVIGDVPVRVEGKFMARWEK